MKKILVAYVTKNKNSGINKYLYNFINIIKKEYKDVEFDFLTSDEIEEVNYFVTAGNGKIFKIPSLKNPVKRYCEIKKLIDKYKYDMVYINISESFNICTALAAKKCNIKRVVIHSHAAGPSGKNALVKWSRMLINKLAKRKLCSCGSVFLGCSRNAGMWMFEKDIVNSKKFRIINNSIDIAKYQYNLKIRNEYRKRYNLKDNDIVLGNIGNFEAQKNQIFLLRILSKLIEKDNYKLLLVGTGKMQSTFENYIKNSGLKDKVIFTGSVNNVFQVVQAMDIFVFPSVLEGFGIAALEAQASGLPTILSDKVPKEVIVSYDTVQIPLKEDKWIEYIEEIKNKKRNAGNIMPRIYEYDNSNINQYKYIVGGKNE